MAEVKQVKIPDIGGATDVDVIEVFVKPGVVVAKEDALITLEGDKATMEIPAPDAGKVTSVALKVGDKVSEGDLILTLEATGAAKATKAAAAVELPVETVKPGPIQQTAPEVASNNSNHVNAGPAMRRLARELDLDITKITGTGPKGRITKDDIKRSLTGASPAGGLGLDIAPAQSIDFSKYGEVEIQALNKIKKLTAKNVHRSWVTIPHVTQFGKADITKMEAFRQSQKDAAKVQGIKLTPLVFIMKAVIACLKAFPNFNASLDAAGENLVLKKYYHIGVAVDTPNGLVVPVIRDVDQKGLFDLARELGDISEKARTKGLSLSDMEGSCFTISSLGGIGGTAFTPIIKDPDAAILGVSKAETQPIYKDGEFEPRLMLPLSLSYDHRIVDGADGARFMVFLASCLSDTRTLLL